MKQKWKKTLSRRKFDGDKEFVAVGVLNIQTDGLGVGCGVDWLSLWTGDDFLFPSLLPQIELTHIFILSLNFVSRGRCPFFANLQRIKKEREREKERKCHRLCLQIHLPFVSSSKETVSPSSSLASLAGGVGGWGAVEGSSWATGEAQDVDERNSREGFFWNRWREARGREVTGSQTELFGEKNFMFTLKGRKKKLKKKKNKKGDICSLGNLIPSTWLRANGFIVCSEKIMALLLCSKQQAAVLLIAVAFPWTWELRKTKI